MTFEVTPDGLVIASGCITKPLMWWDENIERFAEEHGYTPEQQREYRVYIEMFKTLAAVIADRSVAAETRKD